MMGKDKGRVEPVIDPALLHASSSELTNDALSAEKKNKKRHRKDAEHGPDTPAEEPHKKKKKRKDHAEDATSSAVSEGTGKKHKKKKQKEQAQVVDDTPAQAAPIPQPQPDAQTSDDATAALVSALISANTAQDGLMQPDAYGAPQPMPVDTSAFLNDMAIASNDEVLQALQHLDLSKIDSLLKSLSETPLSELGGGALPHPQDTFMGMPMPLPEYGSMPMHPMHMPMPMPMPMPPHPGMQMLDTNGLPIPQLQELPTRPRGRPRKFVAPAQPQRVDGDPEPTDHAWLLAHKWMSSAKLLEMVKTEGLVYKKGKFSAIEENALKIAIQQYRENNGLSEEQLYELIFAKDRTVSHQTFWSEITYAVPQRPVNSVYHYVKRAYHPLKQQGRWSEDEDARLKQAVADLGQSWERVSERVGRMPGDCRDRYRNHVALPDKNTGPWTPAEEAELTRIVKRLTIDCGKPADQDVFWGRVSREMGGKRSRQQCRIKWTDSLSKTVKNADKGARWGQEDAFILVHKIDALDVRDDTEIDWRSLLDPGWNIWSPHTLQRRWTTLKRGIKGWEDMSHAEIMDILRVKKGMAPTPPSSRRRAKKRTSTGDAQEGSSRVVSKEFIEDSDDESGEE